MFDTDTGGTSSRKRLRGRAVVMNGTGIFREGTECKSRRFRWYLCTSKSGRQMNGCTSQSPAYKVGIEADRIT